MQKHSSRVTYAVPADAASRGLKNSTGMSGRIRSLQGRQPDSRNILRPAALESEGSCLNGWLAGWLSTGVAGHWARQEEGAFETLAVSHRKTWMIFTQWREGQEPYFAGKHIRSYLFCYINGSQSFQDQDPLFKTKPLVGPT